MRYLLVLLFPLFLFACSEEKQQSTPPADLIPRAKMVEVMAEVHLLEAAMQVSSVPGAQHREFGNHDVFAKFGVTHDQYERSIGWYSTQLEEFDRMYDDVLNIIRRKSAEEMGGRPVPQNGDSTKHQLKTPIPVGSLPSGK